MRRALTAFLPLVIFARASGAMTVGDLARLRGAEPLHLVGLGVVVGLHGTGDRTDAARRLSAACGVTLPAAEFAPGNSALVTVTAELPPFARRGGRIDVTVSATAGAEDLSGGTLVTTPLWAGSESDVYARAQGTVVAHGAAGRVWGGGLVVRDAPRAAPDHDPTLFLELRSPSVQAASAVAEAVREAFGGSDLVKSVRAVSAGEVAVVPGRVGRADPVGLAAALLDTRVVFDPPARIVVDGRSGAVAAPGDLRVGAASVSAGGVSLSVEGAPLRELLSALGRVKVPAGDVLTLLQGLVKVGALRAEIVVE